MGELLRFDDARKAFRAPEGGLIQPPDRINLAIRNDEFLTLLGLSSCDKATLLKAIAGFEVLDEGKMYLDGKPIASVPAHRRPIKHHLPELCPFPHMSVAENVSYSLPVRLRKYFAPLDLRESFVPASIRSLLIVDIAVSTGTSFSRSSRGSGNRSSGHFCLWLCIVRHGETTATLSIGKVAIAPTHPNCGLSNQFFYDAVGIAQLGQYGGGTVPILLSDTRHRDAGVFRSYCGGQNMLNRVAAWMVLNTSEPDSVLFIGSHDGRAAHRRHGGERLHSRMERL